MNPIRDGGEEIKETDDPFLPSLKALYRSLGIDEKEALASITYRLNVIHIRGVNEMSTDDILDYFKDLGCTSVEWINDYSCNGVWPDASLAAKAMLSMSKEVKPEIGNEESTTEPSLPQTNEIVMVEEEDSEDDGIELTDDDDQEFKEKVKVAEKPESSEEFVTETEVKTLGIPVPPGRWRLGNPHEKSHAILMRFALKGDKKLPGAEKRSQYYQKYGNPNYGGMVGLISKSKKRKYRDIRWKNDKVPIEKDDTKSGDDFSAEDSDEQLPNAMKKMKTRRLYADEEEEKQAKRRSRATSPSRSTTDLRNKLTSRSGHSSSHRSHHHTEDDFDSSEHTRRPSIDLRSKLRNKSRISTDETEDRDFFEEESSEGKQESDLRRKLNRLRKDKKWKHRSPLVVELLTDNSD